MSEKHRNEDIAVKLIGHQLFYMFQCILRPTQLERAVHCSVAVGLESGVK